jgi:hypothetical protein
MVYFSAWDVFNFAVLKGTVARDFRPSVFFINQPHILYISD